MDIVMSDDVGKSVLQALGLSDLGVSRVIVDLEVAQPARVYVEMFASKKMLELDWAKLKGACVNVLDKESP